MSRGREPAIGLAKISLIEGKTELYHAKNLTQLLGGPDIYIKRDDETGLGLGGNKVRKLEYLLGEAVSLGCRTAVTTASVYSNFLRIFTAACCRLGLRPVVFARCCGEPVYDGNLLCMLLLGAEIHFLPTDDPYAPGTVDAMRAYAANEEAEGRKAYVIHLGLFSGPLATVGYIDGGIELYGQMGDAPDAVYCAVGSGGTYAGLLAAALLRGIKTRVRGASVNVAAETLEKNVRDMVTGAGRLIGAELAAPPGNVFISDDYKHPGYGQVNDEGLEAMLLLARTEGIVLDPVYTGKAMAMLIDEVRKKRFARGQRVVFLHSGGSPNLFTHGRELYQKLTDGGFPL